MNTIEKLENEFKELVGTLEQHRKENNVTKYLHALETLFKLQSLISNLK